MNDTFTYSREHHFFIFLRPAQIPDYRSPWHSTFSWNPLEFPSHYITSDVWDIIDGGQNNFFLHYITILSLFLLIYFPSLLFEYPIVILILLPFSSFSTVVLPYPFFHSFHTFIFFPPFSLIAPQSARETYPSLIKTSKFLNWCILFLFWLLGLCRPDYSHFKFSVGFLEYFAFNCLSLCWKNVAKLEGTLTAMLYINKALVGFKVNTVTVYYNLSSSDWLKHSVCVYHC